LAEFLVKTSGSLVQAANLGWGREMTEAEALGCGQQAKGKYNRLSKQQGAAGVEK